MTASELVRPFAAIGAGDVPAVGGKGASLGELARSGARVPPGFVVTTGAFERALAALDPDGSIRRGIGRLPGDDPDAVRAGTAGFRRRIESIALPADLRAAVTEQYRALGSAPETAGGRAPVAVRSSATSEDSAEASFAGLQDTYLWVRGEASVLEHVRRCWASLYSVESVTYRRRLGLPEEGLAMGVVVQRMVDPRCAGVMFTRSPTTGDRSVVAIEGSWGLGSAIVSGEVTPDAYAVNKVTGEILSRRLATKVCRHRMDPSGAGVLAEDVPGHLRQQACLSDEEVRELARTAKRVEKHYGVPQDIEWAISRDPTPGGNVFLLQSRPETAWGNRDPEPVAEPKARAVDHVFERMGRAGTLRHDRGAAR